jgi:hypothetical protein
MHFILGKAYIQHYRIETQSNVYEMVRTTGCARCGSSPCVNNGHCWAGYGIVSETLVPRIRTVHQIVNECAFSRRCLQKRVLRRSRGQRPCDPRSQGKHTSDSSALPAREPGSTTRHREANFVSAGDDLLGSRKPTPLDEISCMSLNGSSAACRGRPSTISMRVMPRLQTSTF